jgi:RNA processing factor Prp31
LKDHLKKLEHNLDKIKNIDGVRFEWDYNHPKLKNDRNIAVKEAFQGESIGVIAQQVEEIVPEIVWTDDEGYKSVQYGLMVSLGVGSIQEQQKRIDQIYDRINKIKNII